MHPFPPLASFFWILEKFANAHIADHCCGCQPAGIFFCKGTAKLLKLQAYTQKNSIGAPLYIFVGGECAVQFANGVHRRTETTAVRFPPYSCKTISVHNFDLTVALAATALFLLVCCCTLGMSRLSRLTVHSGNQACVRRLELGRSGLQRFVRQPEVLLLTYWK